MAVGLPLVFAWAFEAGDLTLFLVLLVPLGICGPDFAIFFVIGLLLLPLAREGRGALETE
jgi:hypothetical protein